MELTIQILTIIVDVLIIIFVLFLITLAGTSIALMKKLSTFVDNLSDMKFWFSLIKKIPSSMKKKK